MQTVYKKVAEVHAPQKERQAIFDLPVLSARPGINSTSPAGHATNMATAVVPQPAARSACAGRAMRGLPGGRPREGDWLPAGGGARGGGEGAAAGGATEWHTQRVKAGTPLPPLCAWLDTAQVASSANPPWLQCESAWDVIRACSSRIPIDWPILTPQGAVVSRVHVSNESQLPWRGQPRVPC